MLSLLLFTVCSVAAEEPALTYRSRATREADARLHSHLNKVVDCRWKNVPLRDVIGSLARQMQVPIFVDDERLDEDGFSANELCTLDVGELTLRQALHFLVDIRGMNWEIRNGMIAVTSSSQVSEHTTSRVHDLKKIRRRLEKPIEWSTATMSGLAAELAIEGHDTNFDDDSDEADLIRDPHREAFAIGFEWMLTGLHSEEFLGIYGGPRVSVVENQVVTRASRQGHEMIAGLIEALVIATDRPLPERAIDVRRPGYPRAEDIRIEKALDQLVTVNYEATVANQVLQDLLKKAGIRSCCVFEPNDEHPLHTKKINLKLEQAPLRSVIAGLLEPLEAVYSIDEGLLLIHLTDVFSANHSTVVYQIDHLPISLTPEKLSGLLEPIVGDTGGGFEILPPLLMVVRADQKSHEQVQELLDELEESAPRDFQPITIEQYKPRTIEQTYGITDTTAIDTLITQLQKRFQPLDPSLKIARIGTSIQVTTNELVHGRIKRQVFELNRAARQARKATPAAGDVAP